MFKLYPIFLMYEVVFDIGDILSYRFHRQHRDRYVETVFSYIDYRFRQKKFLLLRYLCATLCQILHPVSYTHLNNASEVAVVLLTEGVVAMCSEFVYDLKLNRKRPLLSLIHIYGVIA